MVKLDDVLSSPVNCAITTNSSIEKYAEIARTTRELLPIVKIGISDGRMYAINHHDVILGCKRAGSNHITEVNATIENYSGSTEILIAHFTEINQNELVNPVSLYDTIGYLQEKLQIGSEKILEKLQINDTPYEKLILSNYDNCVSSRSIENLQHIVNNLSERKNLLASQISIPLYILNKISKMQQEEDQLRLIAEIKINLDTIPDGKFAWLTPEQIDMIVKFNRQESTHEENSREESVIAVPTEIKNIAEPRHIISQNRFPIDGDDEMPQKQTRNGHDDENDVSPAENPNLISAVNEETQKVQKTMPNMVIIPDEKGNPDILVNKKTGAVCKIEPSECKDIIKTASIDSKRLYSIPMQVTAHLEFDESDNKNTIRYKNFDTVNDLEAFLMRFQNKSPKLSLFWNAA